MKEYYIGQYEKSMPNTMTIREKLSISKKCGFDYVELSIDESDEKLKRLYLNDSEKKELKNTIEGEGQPIYSICLSAHRKYPLGSADEKTAKKAVEISKRAVELAAYLGVRNIQLAGYDVYYEPSTEDTKKRFYDNLSQTGIVCIDVWCGTWIRDNGNAFYEHVGKSDEIRRCDKVSVS